MKSLRCDVCLKTFDKKFSLNRHKHNVHSQGQHRYHCKECPQTFLRQDNLQRHERSHRAEGLVECNICSRGFRSDYIAQHKDTCKKRAGQRNNRLQAVLKVRAFSAHDHCKDKQFDAIYDETAHVKMVSFKSDFGVEMEDPMSEQPTELVDVQHDALEQDLQSKVLCSDLRYHMERDNVEMVKIYGRVLLRTNNALLMHACSTSSIRVARYLLSAGADINKQDSRGNTALHVACHAGTQNIVELLLNAGANVHLRNSKGYTALALIAARGDQTTMATLLLSVGAKVNEHSTNGQYPSAICQNCGLKGCSCHNQLLLSPAQSTVGDEENRNGTRLDEGRRGLDARHTMPLFLALKYGTAEMVQILLKAGSRVDVLPPECRDRLLRNREDNVLSFTATRYLFAKDKLRLLSWYSKSTDFPSDTINDVSLGEIAELTEQIVQHFREGNVLQIKRLMGSGPGGRPFLDTVATSYIQTYHDDILGHARKHHQLDIAALVLERGYDGHGRTSLLEKAIKYGGARSVMLLLDAGALVHEVSAKTIPALRRDAKSGGRDIYSIEAGKRLQLIEAGKKFQLIEEFRKTQAASSQKALPETERGWTGMTVPYIMTEQP